MSRVLIVANRLPTTATIGPEGLSLAPSAGGLATGLDRIHQERGGIWIGSPGVTSDQLDETQWKSLTEMLGADRLVPVPISKAESDRFYQGFSNSFIWPILHSVTGKVPLDTEDWAVYREINQRFADAVVAGYQPGDLIWIHDFHLFLVPAMIRSALPDAAIGFFLHVPFPTADVFRTLPNRLELLRGMLGSTLIGFHTATYLRHFSVALAELLGLSTDIDRIPLGDRSVRLGAFPIGIDAASFDTTAREPGIDELVREIVGPDEGQLMVSVDRLDYTKGVPRRLLAFERLLTKHPELHERVRLLNVSVPTREAVPAYQEHRQEVDSLVGRINGRFATPRWNPIHYMFRGIDRRSLVALYKAADVMLVTPIRDGMNLVAKEFVASRVDDDGVLVLSEFAGAAADMGEAVIVNPYEIDHLADKMAEALVMPREERQRRMAALRIRVAKYDNDWWATTFLRSLETEWRSGIRQPVRLSQGGLQVAIKRFLAAPRRVFVLDYDGTLVSLVDRPETAIPDDALLALLEKLTTDRRNRVHIATGRSRGFLDRWLGHLPIHLHAEHGAASRRASGKWNRSDLDLDWIDRVRAVLEDFTRVTPGAFTEVKEYGLCWHWRTADPGAARSASELALHLSQVLQRTGADVLVGNRIVEVRPAGINKGLVGKVVANGGDQAIFAAGDDSTDEDLFRGLPPEAITVKIGPGSTVARFSLPDVAALRQILRELAAD